MHCHRNRALPPKRISVDLAPAHFPKEVSLVHLAVFFFDELSEFHGI